MIFSKLWERHFFFEALKLILFFLGLLYLVYAIIDFSIHSARFFTISKGSFFEILLYYFNIFIVRLNLFLSLTFMLSLIKILADMNIHNELTALRLSGISSKQIARPFFIIALILCAISYLNFEFYHPKASIYTDNFKGTLRKTKYKKKSTPNVLYLEDDTRLVYQSYNLSSNELFDVYWIRTNSDIWHAKALNLSKNPINGTFVDHLTRNEKDVIIKQDSFNTFSFDEIKIDNSSSYSLIPYENRAISTLLNQCIAKKIHSPKERAEVISQLNFKLAMPFFPFLILIAIFPSLIRFSRNISIFFICSLSLFGFVIFMTIMDSALILAENQVTSPTLIVWLPLILVLSIFGKRFTRI